MASNLVTRPGRHFIPVDRVNGGTRLTGRTHTFYLTKGWCTPARFLVKKAYKPLGIKADFSGVELVYEKDPETGKDKPTPKEQSEAVRVNDSQADWAEYVLGAVCGQTNIQVTGGIRSRANFEKGLQRRGVPMPWLYDALQDVPPDSPSACAKSLPPEQRKEAEEAIRRGELGNSPAAAGLRFTHEGRRRTPRPARTRERRDRRRPARTRKRSNRRRR